jgi:hypothetical protein
MKQTFGINYDFFHPSNITKLFLSSNHVCVDVPIIKNITIPIIIKDKINNALKDSRGRFKQFPNVFERRRSFCFSFMDTAGVNQTDMQCYMNVITKIEDLTKPLNPHAQSFIPLNFKKDGHFFPTGGSIMERKYLKYKTKYLHEKNKQN